MDGVIGYGLQEASGGWRLENQFDGVCFGRDEVASVLLPYLLVQYSKARGFGRFLWELEPLTSILATYLPDAYLPCLYNAESLPYLGHTIRYIPERVLSIRRAGKRAIVYYQGRSFFGTALHATEDPSGQAARILRTYRTGPVSPGGKSTGPEVPCECHSAANAVVGRMEQLLRDVHDLPGWLQPRRWYGPGALADTALREVKARRSLSKFREDSTPPALYDALRRGYFGGRVEAFRIGGFPCPVYRHDLHSAYGWAMAQLPAISRIWFPSRSIKSTNRPLSIWRCTWDVSGLPWSRPGPLPYRSPDGKTSYPAVGQGWYYLPEVKAALKYASPSSVHVHEGWVNASNRKSALPRLVETLYRLRQQNAIANPRLAALLRLVIVSVYGKLAQQVGRAAYGCLPAASFVTALIRARLLEACHGREDQLISFATDGIYSQDGLGLECGPEMGAWGETRYTNGTLLLPGLSRFRRNDGTWDIAERSYQATTEWWEHAISDLNQGGSLKTSVRLLVTRRLAQLMPDEYAGLEGTYQYRHKTLNPYTYGKRQIQAFASDTAGQGTNPILDWERDSRGSALLAGSRLLSAPYEPPGDIVTRSLALALAELLADPAR